MEKNNEYILFKIIDINFGDPISSMLLTKDHLIIGTMLGQIYLFTFQTKNISILSEKNSENISNMSYNFDDNIINLSIGDESILRYKEDKNDPTNINLYQKVFNYSTEMEHSKNCENAFIFLSSHYIFRIQLSQPEEKCLNILEIDSDYEIKSITNSNNFYIGKLPMTNYIVPFCFDGENFAWVEFTGADKRNICIANVLNNFHFLNTNKELKPPYKKNIDEKFGHISHLKILDKNKIFLVRSLNICEIHQLNNDFTLLESFRHIGDEVYAVEIYYHNECVRYRDNQKESSDFFFENNNLNKINEKENNNNNSNIQINFPKSNEIINKNLVLNGKNNDETISRNDKDLSSNNEDKPLEKSKTEFISKKIRNSLKKINEQNVEKNKLVVKENYSSMNSDGRNSIDNNFEKNENKKNANFKNYYCDSDIELSFSIITLDIDGNVNLYQYGKENTLFNLYDFKDISQKMKNYQFFSMGYEYYIKSNLNYFCISTDLGCIIIKKNF